MKPFFGVVLKETNLRDVVSLLSALLCGFLQESAALKSACRSRHIHEELHFLAKSE